MTYQPFSSRRLWGTNVGISFKQVAIVSGMEDHLRRDKLTMQKFRPGRVLTFSSGEEALAVLGGEDVDIVICDTRLADMDGTHFIRILRQIPRFRTTPVMMVTTENAKNAVLDAISSGCTGYVLRPYSFETFQRHIVMAQQLQRFSEIEVEQLKAAQDMVAQGDFDDAIEEFEEILTLQDEAQKYYDMGCDYLFRQKFGKAIVSFNKALKINDLFAEAYHGLAQAYMGKGDSEKYKNYMQKAAEVHAQFDRMEEAKTLFIEILKHDVRAPNPYNTLGVRLRRNGDYPGAVHAYKRALELTPDDENVHYNLAKAFHYMGDREKATTELIDALQCNSDFPEALKFHQELLGTPWRGVAVRRPASEVSQTIKDV
ncbi:tetratricopeptide (TPR) repeat protein [Desulfobaculum xiamenense]|uniref:Tetratricopeptide (TPR) repeat protein n=1 Tax=Desulfobaculum xiamenense TaxID=995050 RepID=A0A846QN05_9BACT|nr:response regulator [Desulfobaculum xiamenense]NJB67852.1 tetratricopeptide (TPR) repeat protein [Desulfobaculum xiamenense]